MPADPVILSTSSDLQNVVADVERELLNEIVANLDQKKISVQESQAIAKEFLSLLPIEDKKDLVDKLRKLSTDHEEAGGVFLHYAEEYEESEKQRKLQLMSQHIKNGEIDSALAVAKGEAK